MEMRRFSYLVSKLTAPIHEEMMCSCIKDNKRYIRSRCDAVSPVISLSLSLSLSLFSSSSSSSSFSFDVCVRCPYAGILDILRDPIPLNERSYLRAKDRFLRDLRQRVRGSFKGWAKPPLPKR